MNRFFLYILSFLMILMILSCGKKYDYDLNLNPGEAYPLHFKTLFEGEQTLMGQKQITQSELVHHLRFLVNEVVDDGYNGHVYFEKTILNINLQYGVLSVNSEEVTDNPISHVFYAMKQHPIMMHLEKSGEVKLLQTMDQYFDQILNEILVNELTLEEKIDLKNQLLEQFNDDNIQSQIELFTTSIPNKKVGKGSTWNKKIDISKPVAGHLKKKYEVVGIDEQTIELKIEGALTPNKKAAPVKVQDYETTFNLKGPINGHLIIQTPTGWPITGTIIQSYEGHLDMKVNKKETKVPIVLKATTELLREEF